MVELLASGDVAISVHTESGSRYVVEPQERRVRCLHGRGGAALDGPFAAAYAPQVGRPLVVMWELGGGRVHWLRTSPVVRIERLERV